MNEEQKAALQDALAPLQEWEGLTLTEIAESARAVARLADRMQGVFTTEGPCHMWIGPVGADFPTEEEKADSKRRVAAFIEARTAQWDGDDAERFWEACQPLVEYRQPSDERLAELEADAKRVCEVIGVAIQIPSELTKTTLSLSEQSEALIRLAGVPFGDIGQPSIEKED